MNRFMTWTLPVFDPQWKEPCLTCKHLDNFVSTNADNCGQTLMRCTHPKTGNGRMFTICFDARFDGPCGKDASLRDAR